MRPVMSASRASLTSGRRSSQRCCGDAVGAVADFAAAELLDLCYEEDVRAAVDMNVIMTGGRYIEVQGTAEGQPYDRARLNRLLDVAQIGIDALYAKQREALADLG